MSADLKKVRVLIPGNLHPHAVVRVEETFDAVRSDSSTVAALEGIDRSGLVGIAAMTRVDADLIDSLPDLEIVASFGVGYDHVDAAHAATRNVMVTNTPDVLTEEVADTAVGLLLNTVRELPRAETWLREGRWQAEGPYPLTRGTLRGRRIGIFGMGRIGQAVAARLAAFNLTIAYHNRRQVPGVPYRYFGDLVEMAANVDTLISVAPATPETHYAVNREVLEALGPTGVFINIGRGTTVDEAALAKALTDGVIQAAGLDVFEAEPAMSPAILAAPNTCLLPHVGSATHYTRQAMANLVVDNLVAWFSTGEALTPVLETASLPRRGAIRA